MQEPAPDEAATDGVEPASVPPAAPGNATTAQLPRGEQVGRSQGDVPVARKGDLAARTQKAKESTQKLVSKMVMSKVAGAMKTPGTSEQAKVDKKAEKATKTVAGKTAVEESRVRAPVYRALFPPVDDV